MNPLVKPVTTIQTKDAAGEYNGYVMPIWHIDEGPPIEQVYVTAIAGYSMKGPHLHKRREGRFTCLRGELLLVMWFDGKYHEFRSGSGMRNTILVPAGVPAALYNLHGDEALVANMPFPAWRDNSDEHKVEGWTYAPRASIEVI